MLESVKGQGAKTSSEFRNLADSRVQPGDRAATGQPLTRMLSRHDIPFGPAEIVFRLSFVLLQPLECMSHLHVMLLKLTISVGEPSRNNSFLSHNGAEYLRLSLSACSSMGLQDLVSYTRRYLISQPLIEFC